MATPKLTPEAWNQVRIAWEADCTPSELSSIYKVSEAAIRKRANKEKWRSPSFIKAEAEKKMMEAKYKMVGQGTRAVSDVPSGAETAQMVLMRRGEAGSLKASELLLHLLERAQGDKLKPLSTVIDVNAALGGLRKAAGMDKAESANLSVSLAMFSGNEAKPWREVGPDSPENPIITRKPN